MAKLINGNGNPAVYAAEDSDWFAAIMGNTTAITAIGEQFRADQADANTIEVFDGVIITQEGRRIQLDANDVDLFTIPTGTPGDTSYYIIGYHLVTDSDSNQSCETFVQKMEDGTETIPEDTFRGGADDVYISLYRITQDGLNIDSIDLLLPSIKNIKDLNDDVNELNADLSVFSFRVNNGVPEFSIDGGTTWQKLGASPTVYRGTFSSPSTPTRSITVTHNLNINPSKAQLRLYGVGSSNGYSYQQNFGLYVTSFGANSFTVETSSNQSSYVLVGNFSYELTVWS